MQAKTHPPRYTFGHRMKLHGRRAFASVFEGRKRRRFGPVLVYVAPNARGHPRLGLTVSRRVGKAATRTRIKRRLREAFRLNQHDWPGGWDVVCVVHPHDAMAVSEYETILRQVRDWTRSMTRKRDEDG